MTPEFKVDFERGARIGLDEALFCESKTVDQISAIVDAVRAKTGRMLLTRLDQSKYEALLARHGADLEYRSPLPHRHSWPPSSDAQHRASGDRHGRNLRSAGRSGSRPDIGLRRATVSRIYRHRRRGPLAPPRKDRGHSIVACCHRRRGHGRGSGQRRRRSGFQPGDRVANVRRLRRRAGRRDSASRRASQLCARNIGRQYRQWLWRGLRGLANIASPGGVANLGRSDCAPGCFPYCDVDRRNRQCPLWAATVEKSWVCRGFGWATGPEVGEVFVFAGSLWSGGGGVMRPAFPETC